MLFRHVCQILVPLPGIKPVPTEVDTQWSPDHWTAREVPSFYFEMHQNMVISSCVQNFSHLVT